MGERLPGSRQATAGAAHLVPVISVHGRQLQLQVGHLGHQLQLLGLQSAAVQQLLRSQRSEVTAGTSDLKGSERVQVKKRYLLQQLLCSIQLPLVMLQAGLQVPDLLTLNLHLVRENTDLEQGAAELLPQQMCSGVSTVARSCFEMAVTDRKQRGSSSGEKMCRHTWRMRHSLSFSSRDRRSW